MVYSHLLNMLRANNPFATDKVIDPWEDNYPSVATINARSFQELNSLVAQKANNPVLAVGALMHGNVGSGKTHMIKRIAESVYAARRPILVADVRPIMDPTWPFSYLLREVIGSLHHPMVKDGASASQFDRLIALWLLELVKTQLSPAMAAKFRERPERILNSDLSDIDFNLQPIQALPHELANILRHYHKQQLRSCVVDWLAGNALTPECVKELQVSKSSIPIKARETAALDLLIALGEILTRYQHCLIVCFDNWGSLITSEQIKATEYMIGELFDSVKGMLPVVLVNKSEWEENFSKTLNQYIVSRLQHNSFALKSCTREDAFSLIKARLGHVLQEDATDIEPFTQDQLDKVFGIGNLSPRAVLNLGNEQLHKLICKELDPPNVPPITASSATITTSASSPIVDVDTNKPLITPEPISGDVVAMLPDACVNILTNGPTRIMSCGALYKRLIELGYRVAMPVLQEALYTHTERFDIINSKDDIIIMLNADWLHENLNTFS